MPDDVVQTADPSADGQVVDPAAGVQPVVPPVDDEFTAKVRAGGQFAVDQVKAAQRQQSKLTNKLGPLEPIVDAVGGADALQQHLRRLSGIISNKKMLEIVEHFEKTGELPKGLTNGAAPEADPYEDPWDPKIKPVQDQVSTLQAELRTLRGERGVEKVRGFFNEFFEEFPLDGDGRKALATSMGTLATQWASTPQGLQALDAMNAETFRSLALSKLTKDQLRAVFATEQEKARVAKAATATDVPPRGTTGKQQVNGIDPVAAYEQVCRELGQDPNLPLLRG